MRNHIRWALGLLAVFVATACGRASDEGALLGGEDTDAVFAEIDRRLNLTIVPLSSGGETLEAVSVGSGLSGEYNVGQLLGNECRLTVLESGVCVESSVATQNHLCRADLLMRLVLSPVATRLPLPSSWVSLVAGASEVLVPPQDAETRYALSRLAFDEARMAVQESGEALAGVVGGGGADCWNYGNAGVSPLASRDHPGISGVFTFGEYFAVSYVEGMHLEDEANEEMRRAVTAVADSYFARLPSRRLALRARFSHPTLGLFNHASAVAGGRPSDSSSNNAFGDGSETPDDAGAGYCPSEPLAGGALRAMQYLRQAAPPTLAVLLYPQAFGGEAGAPGGLPAVLLDQLLVTGWNTTIFGGGVQGAALTECHGHDSVACRLSYLMHQPELRDVSSGAELASALGLTVDDFRAARQRLADEFFAFYRSFGREAPSYEISSGIRSSDYFRRYSATGTPPEVLPPSYYAALAAYVETPGAVTVNGAGDPVVPIPSYGGYSDQVVGSGNQLDSMDGALSGLRWIVSRPHMSDDALEPTRSILETELGTRAPTELGRLGACWYAPNPVSYLESSVRVTVSGPEALSSAGLTVVAGGAGLECAVRGTYDGTPCTQADLDSLTASASWSPRMTPEPGFAHTFDAMVSGDSLSPPGDGIPTTQPSSFNSETVLFFVVRLRPGAAPAPGAGVDDMLISLHAARHTISACFEAA
ncbi:MAG: hypothetical protein U0234_26245 [Sandaracinus sp.]